ncbi:MAG: branched-chain amino acid ABC transporter permease [Candidatus Bathyarchaeia archaeon]
MTLNKKLFLNIIGIVVLALIPLLTDNPYIIHVVILSSVYAIFASSWDLISGCAGQINLGHALFFGGGGYIVAFLTLWYNIHPLLCLPLAGLSMAALSLVVGVPSLRLHGPYLAITTLAFSETIRALILAFPEVTRGDEGFSVRAFLHGYIPNYYVSLLLMIVLVGIMHYIGNHRLKLPLAAIRQNEVVAQASGINTTKYKLLSFLISSFCSGVAGAFFAFYRMAVTPEALTIGMTIDGMTMAVIGGRGTILGSVIGAFALTFISESLRGFIYRVRHLIYAALLVFFLMLMPEGIINTLASDRIKSLFYNMCSHLLKRRAKRQVNYGS